MVRININESSAHALGLLTQVQKLLPYTVVADAIQHIVKQLDTNEHLPNVFLALE